MRKRERNVSFYFARLRDSRLWVLRLHHGFVSTESKAVCVCIHRGGTIAWEFALSLGIRAWERAAVLTVAGQWAGRWVFYSYPAIVSLYSERVTVIQRFLKLY